MLVQMLQTALSRAETNTNTVPGLIKNVINQN
jgi:hypothetical protein